MATALEHSLYVVAMTVLFTGLARGIRGSVLLAWLFHVAINTLIFLNTALDIVRRRRLSAAVYGAVALIVVLVAGPRLRSRRRAKAQVESAAES
jgi:hypothetical protein